VFALCRLRGRASANPACLSVLVFTQGLDLLVVTRFTFAVASCHDIYGVAGRTCSDVHDRLSFIVESTGNPGLFVDGVRPGSPAGRRHPGKRQRWIRNKMLRHRGFPDAKTSVEPDNRSSHSLIYPLSDFATMTLILGSLWKGIIMSDMELLKRYAAGEEDAFQELVRQYRDSLYAFLRRFLSQSDVVDDVFQETFMQLYVSRDTFDLSRPLRPWLFTIAANKAKDALRRMQRIDSANLGGMFDSDDHSIDDVLNTLDCDTRMPYDDLVKGETAASVKRVIARMPAKLREILILAYFHKFSYAEIAGILRIPVGTVKSRLHTAVGRFGEDWNASLLCETQN
jgi:RNA polymerase sigma-70 factor (ECF subfamily)